jgi:hypothetical protein
MMLVLEQPLVFGFVMQYAEPDQWLFFGLVSKAWAALYNVVQHEQSACRQRSTIASAAGTKSTSYAAAAASLARAQSVCDWDAALAEKLFSVSRGAAFVGSSDVMAWAKATAGTKWLAWHHQLCMAAAAGNQLATLQELRLQQWQVVKVAAKAAECADLSMLQWVMELQPEWTTQSIITVNEGAAAAADATVKLTWLCHEFSADSLRLRFHFAEAAIKRGSVSLLQWLVLTGYQFDQLCYATTASAAGQLAALRYLVEEANSPWDVAAVRAAVAQLGSVEILQWTSSACTAPWTTAQLSELLVVAGLNDQLHVAEWLRAAGAEWPASFLHGDPGNYDFAVWSLQAMQWARANGCPWGRWDHALCARICRLSLFSEQERQARQSAMLWAHSAGCPCSSWRHRFARALVREHSSSSSSSSSSSISSGTSSSSSDDTVGRWNAELFRLFFSDNELANWELPCCVAISGLEEL